jgi:beta-galactosidase
MTSSASQDGQRFLHLLNLEGFAKDVHLTENGEDLLDGRALVLGPREALMVPLNVSFGDVRIVYATAEIAHVLESDIAFRLSQKQDVIALQTDRAIAESEEYTIDKREGMTLVTSCKQAAVDDRLTVRWT